MSGDFRQSMGGLRDLMARYRDVARQSWAHRERNASKPRSTLELAFLPAHLELIETPPHPCASWTGRLLLAVTVGIGLLAALGRIDTVTTAPGHLAPVASIRIVQSATIGVVRKILVQNGDRVVAGQVLLELDPTQASADANSARASMLDTQLAMARAQALLSIQGRSGDPIVSMTPGTPLARQNDSQNLAISTYREYLQKLASLRAELQRRESELATAREETNKLTQTAPLARQEANDYKKLSEDNFVSKHDYLDKETIAIQQSQELAAGKSHQLELMASVEEQRRDIDNAMASFRREQLETINKAEAELEPRQDEETKANAKESLTRLTSPVDGIVEQLSVHTVGGVVSATQALMEIVPDETLEVDARIGNRDIGFVNVGQSAVVKISTFPYTRFGYLTGAVTKVSTDATLEKGSGLVFPARISIPGNRFRVGDKWVNLSPGMEVAVEIKTGRQRVWQYFLSPLIELGHDSLRER
jgi:hemolysin D